MFAGIIRRAKPLERVFVRNSCSSSKSLVQKTAPDFTSKAVVNGQIQMLNLREYASGKYCVLFFYPLDFTFVCPTEIVAFNERLAEFEAVGTKVVGVSVDSEYSHLAWTSMSRQSGGVGPLKFPLVSDLSKQISKEYGVLLDAGISLRGLFIIDPSGKVRQSTVNDLPIGRSVDETLRLVKAIQHFDVNGEIVPNPEGSKKYFAQLK